MPRKRSEPLPPLKEVLPDFPGFFPADNCRRELPRWLTRATDSLRRPYGRSFYSLREIATFFKIPLRTAALAYQDLERAGILCRLRGSYTELLGHDKPRRSDVRGVVGVPVSLDHFINLPRWRTLIIMLKEELRRAGFVADLIFFNGYEDRAPGFASVLNRHQPDAILWFFPFQGARQNVLALRERGVPVICIGNNQGPSPYPSDIRLCWRRATASALEAWRRDNITRAVLLEEDARLVPVAFRGMHAALATGSFAIHRVAGDLSAAFETILKTTDPLNTAICLLNPTWCQIAFTRHPELARELLCHQRVLLGRGRVHSPRPPGQLVLADVMEIDFSVLVRHVVLRLQELPSLRAQTAAPEIIEAFWRPSIDLEVPGDRS